MAQTTQVVLYFDVLIIVHLQKQEDDCNFLSVCVWGGVHLSVLLAEYLMNH